MVMDPNDKQRHKPSPKHTLEEVRKSLEDMVRNEFDDVRPEDGESASTADSSTADPTAHSHRSFQSLPRRKPVGIDTEQLLHSLKGLISHELAEGGDATGGAEQTNTGIETEPAPPPTVDATATKETASPADATVTKETLPPVDATATKGIPPADAAKAQEPVTAEPDDENLAPKEVPNEAENVTLGTLPEDDVPEVDLSSEFESEAELLELEAMAKALADEAGPPPSSAAKAETAKPEPETADAGPITVVEPEMTPSVQSSSPPPSVRVVDLPHTSGPLKAFAVYDPALGGDPDIGEVVVTESQAQTDTISEAPVFVSQWLDELSRQPSYSELGLLEGAEKSTSAPPTEQSAPDLKDELTIDLPAVTADTSDDFNAPEGGVEDSQDKSRAGQEPANKPVVRTPQWTDMDRLQIPGAEQDTVDVSAAPSQSVTDEDDDTGIQLALDIPGATKQSPESEPRPEEPAPAIQSDEIAEVDLGAVDTGPASTHVYSDETERAEKGESELTLASDDSSASEPANQSPPSEPTAGIVGPDEQELVNIPAIDFGEDAPVVAEESVASGHGSTGPAAPSDAEPKPASPPAMEPGKTSTELSLADGPLLGPSRPQEETNDSATIDLDGQGPETDDELLSPAPKERPVSPPGAKEEAPTRPRRDDEPRAITGGIIARRRERPGVAPHAPTGKPAPKKRDKPPREIKTEKDSSVAKSQSAPLALSDEPSPAPKLGPAVFKLSDEPVPPAKQAHVPPVVKEKAAVPSSGTKPSPETKGTPTSAPKTRPAVFKPSDEPVPPAKQAHVPPVVKEKAGEKIVAPSAEKPRGAAHVAKEKPPYRRDKPPQEHRTDKTPPPPKSGPATFTFNDEPPRAPKLGPAVFKLSDEPVPPAKQAHVPPVVKEKAAVPSSGTKPSPETKGGTPTSAPKTRPAVFKPSDEPVPPAKQAHVPPVVKEEAVTHSGTAKPSPETKRGTTPSPMSKSASANEPSPAPKLGPAVFKLSDEPVPPAKQAHVPPVVKEEAATHSGTAKPSPETKRGTTPSPVSKSALANGPSPAPKLGPAVFKLSDEPVPPAKQAHVPPVVKEKTSTSVAREKKPESPSAPARKSTTTAPKPPGGTPPAKARAPASSKGDDIPVLEDAVAPADRLRVNPASLASPNMAPAPPTARGAPAKDTAGTRNLAVQVVAKLNTELRKCGERALSPATVDRLQYLLREVLERGAAAADSNRKKR
jgi:hypothetical protein